MQAPDNVKIYEGELASFWFDDSGIFCAISKKVPRTIEKQKANYALIREITGNKRVCLLADNTIISHSVMGKAAAHLFQYFHGQPIPIRSFDNETEAKEWLKQYLNE